MENNWIRTSQWAPNSNGFLYAEGQGSQNSAPDQDYIDRIKGEKLAQQQGTNVNTLPAQASPTANVEIHHGVSMRNISQEVEDFFRGNWGHRQSSQMDVTKMPTVPSTPTDTGVAVVANNTNAVTPPTPPVQAQYNNAHRRKPFFHWLFGI